MRKIQLGIKRLLDIVLSLLGLIFLSPVFLITALLVGKKLGSPVFFVQERPGKEGRIFKMIKFRTMLDARDTEGNLLPNEKRHTKFGRMMRSASLDELPELINVLKGEMSLVGPRPLLVEYLPRYNAHQARRHEMRPGITGWAQINGRNAISWEEKFNYDVWYIDHFNLILDIKIILKTIKKVFVREGINFQNPGGEQKFIGNKKEESVKPLYIIGSGGFSKQVIEIVEEINAIKPKYELLGLIDDDPDKKGREVLGYFVLGDTTDLATWSQKASMSAVIAIGDGAVREKITRKLLEINWVNLIHPKTVISKYISLGKGNIICGGVVVNPETKLGDHCHINIGSTLGHDVTLKSYTTIMPGCRISGCVTVNKKAMLGTGSIVMQEKIIGSGSSIGAGAVVLKDVEEGMVYAGVPAKPLKKNP